MELKKTDLKVIKFILKRISVNQLQKFKKDLELSIQESIKNNDIPNEDKYRTYLKIVKEEEQRRLKE